MAADNRVEVTFSTIANKKIETQLLHAVPRVGDTVRLSGYTPRPVLQVSWDYTAPREWAFVYLGGA